jgi:Na+-transporting methylmalonyl-CoA/oxaloacetate decarboxylase gamma subunit
MESLKFTLVAYGFTIFFAMIIACFIPALAWAIKKMNLDPNEEPMNLAIPSSDSMKEEEAIAVAIAVAHLQRK